MPRLGNGMPLVSTATGAPVLAVQDFFWLNDISGELTPIHTASRTNLVTYSEDFSQWNQIQNVTLTSNSTTSPSGESDATTVLSTDDNSKISKTGLTFTNGAFYTFSVYCKNIDATALKFHIYMGGLGGDITSDFTSEVNTDTWTRVSYTFTPTGTTAAGQVQIARSLPDTESAYFWGAQLEELSYATSYIPTSGTTVTRSGETLDGSGNGTLISSTEGVLYAEISKAQTDNDDYILISLNDGTDTDNVVVGFDSDDDFFMGVRTSVSYDWLYNATTATANTFYKMAIRYKSGDIKAYIDGSPISPSSGSDGASFTFGDDLDNLSFDFGGNNPFYGKVKCLAVFDEGLENDELEILTGTSYASFELLAAAGSYTVI